MSQLIGMPESLFMYVFKAINLCKEICTAHISGRLNIGEAVVKTSWHLHFFKIKNGNTVARFCIFGSLTTTWMATSALCCMNLKCKSPVLPTVQLFWVLQFEHFILLHGKKRHSSSVESLFILFFVNQFLTNHLCTKEQIGGRLTRLAFEKGLRSASWPHWSNNDSGLAFVKHIFDLQ